MTTNSAGETKKFAQNFLTELTGPAVVALSGELGSGKTTFTQGLAEALGVKKRVLSPTFVFLRSYPLTDPRFQTFHHFDLYRCESLADAKAIGLPEILKNNDSLVLIEWPEIAQELLPQETKWLRFAKTGENSREIVVS